MSGQPEKRSFDVLSDELIHQIILQIPPAECCDLQNERKQVIIENNTDIPTRIVEMFGIGEEE